MDKYKLILPISILLGCIILGGFYYASQLGKQRLIEKQQQIDMQAKKNEQENKNLDSQVQCSTKADEALKDFEKSDSGSKFNSFSQESHYNEKKSFILGVKTKNFWRIM